MNKKTTLLLAFSIILPVLLFGQGETSNWYFGNNAGIRFNNNGTVTSLSDGRLDTFEGCTTISDTQGDLLFYTDGISVYDRNHNLMENGSGLFGDPSSTQSALIVPKPLDSNIYYIFTVDTSTSEFDPDFGLNYSVVDIRLNNGNGAVIQKNTRLMNDCSEKIAAVLKDCSDKTIWVVTLGAASGSGSFNTFHAFEISASGVSTDAVKSTFSKLSIEDPRGYLKFSNDGTKMASANMRFGLQLFDFDAQTGIVSNLQPLGINGENDNSYGVEFSPNSRFLYTHSSNFVEGEIKHSSSLVQFDLQAMDIAASQVEIHYGRIFRGALQLGANGKIYRTIALNYHTGTPFLGVINNPNQKGLAANYEHNAIALGSNSTQGLPPFIQSFFNKTDLILNADGTSSGSAIVCIGDSFTLEAEEIPGATYFWEKDGNPVANPDNHIFQIDKVEEIDAGRYSLEIVLANAAECNILGESLIEVMDIPESHNLSLVQCDADSDNTLDGITGFNLEEVIGNADNDYVFYETIIDRNNDHPLDSALLFRNTQPYNQTIYFTAINKGGCENYGELALQVNPITLSDQNVFYACDENLNDSAISATFDLQEIVQTNFPSGLVSFYGSLEDVALEQNVLPTEYTSESATVYARFENNNECQDIVQIDLVVYPSPIFELNNTYEICTDDPQLDISGPEGFDTYRWYKKDGASLLPISDTSAVHITDTGGYELEVGYTYSDNGTTTECTQSSSFTVIPSNRAVIEKIEVQDFSQNNTVYIETSGDGDYEYSLDGREYFDSTFFENVTPGIVTIHIRDKKGCGILKKIVSVMGYPKFFTPNGDGVNDHWRLIGLSKELQANSFVMIFDRYGVLLAQVEPDSKGWDGIRNGTPLPASDYWFKANLEDGRIFKGHFALKR